MSAEFEYLHSFSQPHAAELADGTTVTRTIEQGFHALNDGMTRMMDAQLGPDGTDAFDASCNTCKHFVRKAMSPEEKAERNIFGMPGRCAAKDVPVRGWQRGQHCGFENALCYENRRTGKRAHEVSL